MPTKEQQYAIIKEIESQIIQVDSKLKDEEKNSVSEYVKLLIEKRNLQVLLREQQLQIEHYEVK